MYLPFSSSLSLSCSDGPATTINPLSCIGAITDDDRARGREKDQSDSVKSAFVPVTFYIFLCFNDFFSILLLKIKRAMMPTIQEDIFYLRMFLSYIITAIKPLKIVAPLETDNKKNHLLLLNYTLIVFKFLSKGHCFYCTMM